jgi:hypothetical protein
MPADLAAPAWGAEIRAREDALRLAFLHADLRALDELVADDYLVNSSLHKVLVKPMLLQLLETGRLRYLSFESRIETMQRHGDTVVVMGGDRVVEGPDRACSNRRFTNLWQLRDGRWQTTARHTHVVTLESNATARPGTPTAFARRAYQPTP